MPARVFGVSLIDESNVGDMISCPWTWTDIQSNLIHVDIRDLEELHKIRKEDTVLLGGGGLISPIFQAGLDALQESQARIVGWGLGANEHVYDHNYTVNHSKRFSVLSSIDRIKHRRLEEHWHQEALKLHYPDLSFMQEYGVRDDIGQGVWVPCASCLSPLHQLYRDKEPKFKIVLHLNDLFVDVTDSAHPRMTNRWTSLQDTLDFLSSGETVVTSSYHGAYWATLLNRRVVVVPWSSKFLYFKHKPAYWNPSANLSSAIRLAKNYPDALEECQETNRQWASKVNAMVSA